MAWQIKAAISREILNTVRKSVGPSPNISINQITPLLELKNHQNQPQLHFTPPPSTLLLPQENSIQPSNFSNDIVKSVTSTAQKLIFTLDFPKFAQNVLCMKEKKPKFEPPRLKIVTEFSSPNIAKPFHVGHLRSTIIGNFISNLFEYFDDRVTRLNYLGDWGTQFGYIKVGLDLLAPSNEQMLNDPIQTLYNAYVYAHKLAETDETVADAARKVFYQLEHGTGPNLESWKDYRKYTVHTLEDIYHRLGVTFDEYHWESMYQRKEIEGVLKLLHEKSLLKIEDDGRIVVLANDRRIPVVKSDGTTLYLTRDIAAIKDRFERWKFNRIYYVVDNGQADHFKAINSIGDKIGAPWAGRVSHVKFGRIKGMSTRKGNVVFLKDILDEARDIMKEKQMQSKTTKVDIHGTSHETSDILGISAVIINDLKQRRQRDYEFDWDKALQVSGDTGIKLQYTHCRLCSIEKAAENIAPPEIIDIKYLQEPEAVNLIYEIAKFDEVLLKSRESLESCILVNYLFGLSNAISRAIKCLNVKNEKCIGKQSHRLLLFSKARQTLHDGMKILGLKPLNEM